MRDFYFYVYEIYSCIWSYDNCVPALYRDVGRLKEEGIRMLVEGDEKYEFTIDPILANAVGGIKLMVDEKSAE